MRGVRACVRACVPVTLYACVHVCMCAYAFLVVVSIGVRLCISTMGPVVFDDEIAYVTNAAACKYCICCVVFGLWLVLVVFSCCAFLLC